VRPSLSGETAIPTTLDVFLAAALTAAVTGLGAAPFLLVREMSRRFVALANAVAAGLMLAASHSLVAEGNLIGPWRTLLGLLLGLAAIVAGARLVSGRGHPSFGEMRGLDARKAILLIGVMTAHSFAEGVGVGVSFADTKELATFITAAIAVHNIPEGLAISLMLVPRGVPVWQAALWSVFSSLPQPLMAVPAFLFVTAFTALLPVGLGFAAGAMLWMVFAEIVPEALEEARAEDVAVAVTLSFAGFVAFQTLVLKP
jgi:zinc transporter ZupT